MYIVYWGPVEGRPHMDRTQWFQTHPPSQFKLRDIFPLLLTVWSLLYLKQLLEFEWICHIYKLLSFMWKITVSNSFDNLRDWLHCFHTCARALELCPFVDTCFLVSLHPHHTLLFMSLVLTCSSSVTHVACSAPGSICVCNIWFTWSAWWHEIGKTWVSWVSSTAPRGMLYHKMPRAHIKRLRY